MYRVIQSIIMSGEEVRLKGLDCLAKMANISTASFDRFIDALIRFGFKKCKIMYRFCDFKYLIIQV